MVVPLRVEVPDLTRASSRGEDLARLEIGNPDAERASQTIIARLADYVGSLQPATSK